MTVAKRLQGLARSTGAGYQRVLTDFAFERLLYRLSVSSVRERFVLKGAMLLRVWSDQPYRATRDLDLLRAGAGEEEAIRRDWAEVCTTSVEFDGLEFDENLLETSEIRAANEYAGQRIVLPTRFGKARLRLQIDVGVGDAVWPSPKACLFPSMLGLARASVLSYPLRQRRLQRRNSRLWSFWEIETVALRTTSIFTSSRVTWSSRWRPSSKRYGGHFSAGAHPFLPRLRSA